jgi:hypothetical protein
MSAASVGERKELLVSTAGLLEAFTVEKKQ